MAFEHFMRGRQLGRISGPAAAIWKRGEIALNTVAVQQWELTTYAAVSLFYEQRTARIGLRFLPRQEDGSALLYKAATGVVTFSARTFLDHYGIDRQVTRRYPIVYDAAEQLYVIALAGCPTQRNGKKQRR